MPSKKCGSFFRRSHPPPQANLASSFRRSLGVWILSFRTWDGDRDCVCSSSFLLTLAVTGLIKKRSKYFLLERSVLHAHATISQGENQNIEWQLDRVIGYDVFDKFIKLLLQKIMGAFFAPLLVISGAKLYFLGAVLPFALVYFRRWCVCVCVCLCVRVREEPNVLTKIINGALLNQTCNCECEEKWGSANTVSVTISGSKR